MSTDARKQWLAARRGTLDNPTIGSSEAAAILGWSRFDDRFALWHRKQGLIAEDDGTDDRRDAGTFLEEGILRWYARRTGRLVIRPRDIGGAMLRDEHSLKMLKLAYPLSAGPILAALEQSFKLVYGPDDEDRIVLRSTRYPWLSLSPDALAYDTDRGWGFVDAKNVDRSAAWKNGEKAPAEYSAQIAHATMGTTFAWGGFAVCVGGQALLVVDVERTELEPIETLLREEVPAFVASLSDQYPPPPSGSDASMRALRELYPAHDPMKAVGWAGAIEAAARSWDPNEYDDVRTNAVEQRKLWQAEVDMLDVVLRYVAKDAGKVVLPKGVQYFIRTSGTGRERISRKANGER